MLKNENHKIKAVKILILKIKKSSIAIKLYWRSWWLMFSIFSKKEPYMDGSNFTTLFILFGF